MRTGQMLAALLGWPQATFAAKLDVAEDKKVLIAVARRVPMVSRSSAPAVILHAVSIM